jgi:nicotinamide mononucleotide (NMN) deamidase PncC
VYVAVATAEGTTLRKGVWPGDRDAIRRHATSAALDMVRHACAQNGRRSP